MNDLLSVTDAARILDVAASTVRLMERTGQLRALRTAGGIRLFQREDVEQLARERAQRLRALDALDTVEMDAEKNGVQVS